MLKYCMKEIAENIGHGERGQSVREKLTGRAQKSSEVATKGEALLAQEVV